MAEPEDPNGPTADAADAGEELSEEIARKYDPKRLLGMVSRKAGRSTPLDHDIRAKFERRWKMDLGHVRIYTGEFADEVNRKRDAHAVTIGGTGMILMGQGSYSTSSRQGQALLAHEVTHVAQQRRGLYNKDASGAMPFTNEHEAEAHAEEDRVADGGEIEGGQPSAASSAADAKASADAQKEALEKIRERVLEMAAEAARVDFIRNSMSRRP